MELLAAKCPNCGANIELDKNRDVLYCSYCGTKIIVKDEIKKIELDVKGKIKVDGLASIADKVKRANDYLNAAQYDQALCCFESLLNLSPDNKTYAYKVVEICNYLIDKAYSHPTQVKMGLTDFADKNARTEKAKEIREEESQRVLTANALKQRRASAIEALRRMGSSPDELNRLMQATPGEAAFNHNKEKEKKKGANCLIWAIVILGVIFIIAMLAGNV